MEMRKDFGCILLTGYVEVNCSGKGYIIPYAALSSRISGWLTSVVMT
jgi:hypothetical protein